VEAIEGVSELIVKEELTSVLEKDQVNYVEIVMVVQEEFVEDLEITTQIIDSIADEELFESAMTEYYQKIKLNLKTRWTGK
jgi:hypothetical protein